MIITGFVIALGATLVALAICYPLAFQYLFRFGDLPPIHGNPPPALRRRQRDERLRFGAGILLKTKIVITIRIITSIGQFITVQPQ